MSKENAERLAATLKKLGYVDPVNWDADLGGTVKVLCRLKSDKASLAKWAKVVESILIKADDLKDTPSAWDSHICRLYMLKGRKLVYGWLIAITAENIDTVTNEVVGVIMGHVPKPKAPLHGQAPEIRLRSSSPAADVRGNPIVDEKYRTEVIPMAGLPANYQRNMPSKPSKDGRGGGKGAYGVGNSGLGVFTPPRGRR